MHSLINDKDTAKDFVRINFINDVSSLPDFNLAAEKYLIPITGQDLYDELLEEVEAFEFPAEGDQPVPVEHEDLLRKCRTVVAPFGYETELALIQTQLTDAGLRSISTENMQAAHRWEYNEVKDNLVEKGSFAQEALLKFLFENVDDYESWTDSAEYQEAAELVFKTGSDFNKYFKVFQPWRVWWLLRPQISEAEDMYINSAIGKDFFDQLKDIPDLNAETIEAVKLIKKCVANYTIMKAIEKLPCKITDKGFTVLQSAGSADSVNSGDAPQTDNQLSLMYTSCLRDGDSYHLQMKEHLNKYASETLFADYFSSDKYTAPVTEEPVSKNACRKIFGL